MHKDSALLRHQPLLVADGIAIIQQLVRPRRTLIAAHADSPAESAAHDLIRSGEIDAEVLPVPDRYASARPRPSPRWRAGDRPDRSTASSR